MNSQAVVQPTNLQPQTYHRSDSSQTSRRSQRDDRRRRRQSVSSSDSDSDSTFQVSRDLLPLSFVSDFYFKSSSSDLTRERRRSFNSNDGSSLVVINLSDEPISVYSGGRPVHSYPPVEPAHHRTEAIYHQIHETRTYSTVTQTRSVQLSHPSTYPRMDYQVHPESYQVFPPHQTAREHSDPNCGRGRHLCYNCSRSEAYH